MVWTSNIVAEQATIPVNNSNRTSMLGAALRLIPLSLPSLPRGELFWRLFLLFPGVPNNFFWVSIFCLGWGGILVLLFLVGLRV